MEGTVLKTMDSKAFEAQNMFGLGQANTAYAKYFIGDSFLNPLTDPKSGLFAANVTFEPGCRNNWHIHHAKSGGGQLLICTAGEGWYQEAGKPAQSLGRVPYGKRDLERRLIFFPKSHKALLLFHQSRSALFFCAPLKVYQQNKP